MGHFCRICCRSRANEKFTGRGHRQNVCKDCHRMPRKEREKIEITDELYRFLEQAHISEKNMQRLAILSQHEDSKVAPVARLIFDIGRVHPHKRKRWLKIAQQNSPLFDRAIGLLGVEFFEEILAGYGDFESPLWRILDRYQAAPDWTSRPCDCGSGRAFRDCCLERENRTAEEWELG